MTESQVKARVNFLQYLNTALMSGVGILAVVITWNVSRLDVKIDSIQAVQAVQAVELMRVATNQSAVMARQDKQEERVHELEKVAHDE